MPTGKALFKPTNLLNNVLILYKKSAYSLYFTQRDIHRISQGTTALKEELRRFQEAHKEHFKTLRMVEGILRHYGIRYAKRARGQSISYDQYTLIITIGGDGTFLQAARNAQNQLMLGINSAPRFSTGKLCVATIDNFEEIIQKIIKRSYQSVLWQRLRLEFTHRRQPIDCLNDILICHQNPAAVSRYYLCVRGNQEEQRGSGLWIATAAGSSGAIRSAGGKILKATVKKLQYLPRELYHGFQPRYRLRGEVLPAQSVLTVTSLMQNGMIFVDGTHFSLKFPFNTTLKVSLSPNPVQAIQP